MFKHQTIWITGASSGIGEGLAYAFADKGANLILSARRVEELERVQAACTKNGNAINILPFDLTKENEVEQAVEEVQNMVSKVDILINNGGISQRSYAMDTSLDVDRKIMEVNYFGSVSLTKKALPFLLKQPQSHIVTITSVVGKVGTPLRSGYSASKHALHGFFDALRAELSDKGLTVTLICPGYVTTNISRNALKGDGRTHGVLDKSTAKGLTSEAFARKALKVIHRKKREAWIGGREVMAIHLKRWLPGVLANILRKVNQP